MADSTESIYSQFTTDLKTIQSEKDIESLRIKYLGRKGVVNALFTDITTIEKTERKQFGKAVNDLKNAIEEKLKEAIIKQTVSEDRKWRIDPTEPGTGPQSGSLHLISYAVSEISRIFTRIGFIRMSYPEVEREYFSFDSLNMPKDHPGRDDFETFFFDAPADPAYGKMVLSPHTSSCQVRELRRVKQPPVRMINIAKCYRPNWDTTHTPMFHQFEAMCVDERITIANLKGTIDYFVKEFFGSDRQMRLRPHHFQFTEPSFEVDISCDVCNGTGKTQSGKCRVCKQGWLELAGAGMTHPHVLAEGGIDTTKYNGWAFAFGLERIMMMREGLKLTDMRILYSGDIRFLNQF